MLRNKTIHITTIVLSLLVWLAYWQFEDKIFRWLEKNYQIFYAESSIGQFFVSVLQKLPFQSPPAYTSAALTNWLWLFIMNIGLIAIIFLSKKKTKTAFLLVAGAYVLVIIANVMTKKLGFSEKIIDETRYFFTYLASPLTVIYLVAYFVVIGKLKSQSNHETKQ